MADIAQPGLVKQLAQQGKLKPITYAKSAIAANFAPPWSQLGTFSGKLYALVFKAANKSTASGTTCRPSRAPGVTPPKTWAQLLADAQDAAGVGHAGLLDRRRATAGRSPTCSRTSTCARSAPAKYDQLDRAQDQVDRPVGDHGAEDDGADHRRHVATSPAARAARSSTASTTRSRTRSATPPKAAMVFEADFVGGVITSSTKAKAGTGFNVVPVPVDHGRPGRDRGRDRRRPVRHVPRHAGDRGVREVPRDAAGGRRVGEASAASRTGNKNVPASVYPDAITRATEAADRPGEVGRVRHVRRAAGRRSAPPPARASGGSSRTS